jgi:hypothetical protein
MVCSKCSILTGNKGSYGLASIPGKEEEFKQTVAMSIDYARALHCNQLSIFLLLFRLRILYQKYSIVTLGYIFWLVHLLKVVKGNLPSGERPTFRTCAMQPSNVWR